jgi:breast cancer metastasis-suppressor 1-like protein
VYAKLITQYLYNLFLQSEKSLLWDCIYSELEDKIRRLEDDRNNTDISSGLWLETLFRRSRKPGSGGHHTSSSHMDMTPLSERRRKPITVSGPYIVYMLSEAEILEDWTTIKKALTKRKPDSKFDKFDVCSY